MRFLGIKGNTFMNTWYCKNCKKATNMLYISEDKKHYCKDCLPIEKNKANIRYINQIRERI